MINVNSDQLITWLVVRLSHVHLMICICVKINTNVQMALSTGIIIHLQHVENINCTFYSIELIPSAAYFMTHKLWVIRMSQKLTLSLKNFELHSEISSAQVMIKNNFWNHHPAEFLETKSKKVDTICHHNRVQLKQRQVML